MITQDYYRMDSDCLKEECFRSSVIQFSIWSVHTILIDLSVGLSVGFLLHSLVGSNRIELNTLGTLDKCFPLGQDRQALKLSDI